MRVFLSQPPYQNQSADQSWNKRGIWPCSWISVHPAPAPPLAAVYRCRFYLQKAATIRVHVTADERYDLWLDGHRAGRGSERGDCHHWFYESYDWTLEAGDHVVAARVWSLGTMAPFAQMSAGHGFLLSPQESDFIALLGTGHADWQAKLIEGYEWIDPIAAWGTGANLIVHGDRFPWHWERGEGEGWQPVETLASGADALGSNDIAPGHLLMPATLPPMLAESMLETIPGGGKVLYVTDIAATQTHSIPMRQADNLGDEIEAWRDLLSGGDSLTVPPHTRRRVLIDLDNYYCAYPEVITSGGAGSLVRVHWQESLYEDATKTQKGNRDQTEAKYFVTVWNICDGIGDSFRPDGGHYRFFDTLWWQCGRYVEIVVETQDEALSIELLHFIETRYPLENESTFESSDARLKDVETLGFRTLQMCAHETYMDCPYFEQLMYIGDTRLQCLVTYATSRDDRLPRQALRLFDWSRELSGFTQSRYPTRVRQITPPFALWWVAMLHDYALWRGDLEFVRQRMPGARAVLDAFRAQIGEEGLVVGPDGWNYMDWVPDWKDGMPIDGAEGVSGLLNWQMILVLRQAAQLEGWLDEPEMAPRATRLANELEAAAVARFWNEGRGLFADDVAHTAYSEHCQCLALLQNDLGGHLSLEQKTRCSGGLLDDPDLARTTIYFSHYLFETLHLLGRMDVFFARLQLWFDLKANGLKTTIEMPEPTRSDCHAWGAHPIFHLYASLLGIRPVAPGFMEVEIRPQLAALEWARAKVVHPNGDIEVDLQVQSGTLSGSVSLPDGVAGHLVLNGQRRELEAGNQSI